MISTEGPLPRAACNLCGREDFRVKFKSSPAAYSPGDLGHYAAATDVYGEFGQIVECRGCGLIYTHPRLPEGEILQRYQDQEDQEFAGEDASRSINAYFSLNTIYRFASKGSLLDVGCAAGYFLNAARLHFEPSGVEPGRHAAEFASHQLGLNVHTGRLKDAGFPDNGFDVVCLSDVIEHLADPLSELREIHRITRPGGLLYVVTPNIASFSARLLRGKWWGLRPAHLYYFSPRTLRALLKRAGYDVLLIKSYGRVFRMSYWVSRLQNYSPWVTRSLRWGIDRAGVGQKLVYINTLDSIEVCARKVDVPNE